MMSESLRQCCKRMYADMDAEYTANVSLWRELAEYISPSRGRFTTTEQTRQKSRSSKIINSTATQALNTLGSGMVAGLTSPARPWFRLSTPDPALSEFYTVKQWLWAVETRMREVFSKSNLYTALPTAYQELGLFATTAIGVFEDDEDVVRFYPYTIGTYKISNNKRLVVDVFCREYRYSVRQMVDEFGIDAVSETVRGAFNAGRFEAKYDVVHLIAPRALRDKGKVDAKNKPYMSVWFEKASDEDKVLRESGYDEFPVLVPRWEIVDTDAWGSWCPGMQVRGDVKALQLQMKRKAQAIDKHVDPPMVADPSLRNQRSSILPGDVTYVEAGQGRVGFAPAYQVNPDLQGILLDIQDMEQRIRRGLFEDLFLMLANDTRSGVTAREIQERHEEKLLMLGPVLERLNDELLDPLIDRVFSIMVRKGLIPPPPRELEGIDLKVEYISILAQAQKAVGTSGIERFVQFVGGVAQASQNPNVWDKVDTDQLIDDYADTVGVPPRLVIDDEAVAAKRAAEAEQQQQMQAASMMPAAADMMRAAGGVDMSKDTAFSRLADAAATANGAM